ncbi:MAG: zinc ribbon domain-containing protein [Chromatiales bacterium]|jgi:putative FmdB family regulatory protein
MPIYEYRCESCGHEMEALQKMSDPVLTKCPECKLDTLKKALSAAGFRLKGGGWYETDFKGGKKKNVHEKSDKGAKQPAACSGGGCACQS